LLNRGKIFSKLEITKIINDYNKMSKECINDLIKYLSRQGYIKRIFAGIYYINSFDERERGFSNFEDKELVFMALNKLSVKWYVGLSSALYLKGKTWQTPNQLSIVNIRFSGVKKVNGLKIKFYKIKEDLIFGLKRAKTGNNVDYFYSDPAKTYIDKVYFGETKRLIRVKNTINYLERYPKWVGKR